MNRAQNQGGHALKECRGDSRAQAQRVGRVAAWSRVNEASALVPCANVRKVLEALEAFRSLPAVFIDARRTITTKL